MKKLFVCIFLSVMMLPVGLKAEDFLGAPVMPGGKTMLKTKNRLEMTVPASHEKVVEFYQKALEGEKDIKFRNWKDATNIEDDGSRRWHSISISKQEDTGVTTIVIVRDNWTWIIGTLILRFVGVFVVLLVLLIGMYFSGKILSRFFKEDSQASA